MSHIVRTTMRPDVEVEVGDADYLDLKRQGLLAAVVEESPPSAPALGPAVTKKAAPSAANKEG